MEKSIGTTKKHFCPYCKKHRGTSSLRLSIHIKTKHPDVSAADRLRSTAQARLPGVDLDKVIQRYVDRIECLISLKQKLIWIKSLLSALGILRHWRDDILIMRTAKHEWVQTKEDLTKFFTQVLSNKSQKRTDEQKIEDKIKLHKARLANKGLPEMGDIKEVIMRTKYIKRKLDAAQLESDKRNGIIRPPTSKIAKYLIRDPDGVEYTCRNMAEFCREHNLTPNMMSKVILGKEKQHKGWTGSRVE